MRAMRTSIASLAFALTAAACAPAPPAPVAPPPPAAFPAGPLVDLTHTYEAQSIFWPTADPFRLDKVADGMTPAGYYYASNNFFSSEHGGTHMDAPVHFAQGSHTADQVPLDRLVGPALVIDVTEAGRGGSEAALPGPASRCSQVDCGEPAGQGHRHRHREHRLRPVIAL